MRHDSNTSRLRGWQARTTLSCGVLLSGCTGGCSHDLFVARFNALRGDSYALDGHSRQVSDAGVGCPEEDLVYYPGTHIPFSPRARVHPAFAERLEKFERVVLRVAHEYYARAPRRVVNAGTYVCRTVAHRPGRLSEHALGNALDVVGFDFGAWRADAEPTDAGAARMARLPPALRAQLSGVLRVRVQPHWDARGNELERTHREFLRSLTEALLDEDVFRTMLGPSDPAHATHFHLSMTPWKHINL